MSVEIEEKLREVLALVQKERENRENGGGKSERGVSEKEAKAIRVISDRFKGYESGSSLKVGDIVKWKAGMRNRRFPAADGVAIVTKIYPKPVYDEKFKDSGSPQFHDPMTMVLGVIDEDGDFVEFHYDGNRFEQAGRMDVPPRKVAQLRERFDRLCQTETFQVGDIVTWKEGLRNKKHPEPGSVALVVKVFDEPVLDAGASAGSPYFNEPLRFLIGIIDDDGDFLCFHSDPRRFTRVPVEQLYVTPQEQPTPGGEEAGGADLPPSYSDAVGGGEGAFAPPPF